MGEEASGSGDGVALVQSEDEGKERRDEEEVRGEVGGEEGPPDEAAAGASLPCGSWRRKAGEPMET